MIAKTTTIKLNDRQRRALELYASDRGCNTTPAAISSLINDQPEYKKLEKHLEPQPAKAG